MLKLILITCMLINAIQAQAQLSDMSQIYRKAQSITNLPSLKHKITNQIPKQNINKIQHEIIQAQNIAQPIINQFSENDLQLINKKSFDILITSYQRYGNRFTKNQNSQNSNAIFANYLSYKRLLESPSNINSQDYYSAITARQNLELLCGRDAVYLINSLWNDFKQKGTQNAQNIPNAYHPLNTVWQ